MSERLRFGLIGTGRIGQVHAANISADPNAELSWVADPFRAGAEAVTERYGGIATDATERLLSSGAIDAVLIAAPTPTHVSLIEACVDRGLPVLCEKPIDLDIGRVDALRPKVIASDTPVVLGFNQRFDPSFAEARDRVISGDIGEIEHLSIISRDPSPPPASYIGVSGGIFRDMTIHDFDMARFFLGEIVEVSATGSQVFDDGAREHRDFDTVAVTLLAASGSIATITNSRHSAIGYDQRLEAHGGKGMVQVSNASSSLVRLSTAKAVDATGAFVDLFTERYAEAYVRELSEFIRLVREGCSTSPTFEDGRAALLIADAAQRSATEHVAVRLDANGGVN